MKNVMIKIEDFNEFMDLMLSVYDNYNDSTDGNVDKMFEIFTERVSYSGSESEEFIYQIFVDQYNDWLVEIKGEEGSISDLLFGP
jgi:hypothetical protein